MAERPAPTKFKLEPAAIPEGEAISYFKNGDFIDLCAGPHVMRTGNIGAFKLTTVASAYYKGDEKNPQLQRIYGTAFKNKTEMEAYFNMIEEAKKRDHRKIGTEMGLFAIDTEFVGPGLPLWLPKGTAIVEELERLAKETELPPATCASKRRIWPRENVSNHRPPAISTRIDVSADVITKSDKPDRTTKQSSANRVTSRKRRKSKQTDLSKEDNLRTEGVHEKNLKHIRRRSCLRLRTNSSGITEATGHPGERYYLKAMNCPHHHRIFAAEPRSYRDLPLRLAEYGTCYRYEQSGELFGLMRVRSLNMNDAHIYCTPEQFAQEFNAVNDMYLKYFKIFGIEKYRHALQHHSVARNGDKKYVNEPELWKKTEDMVRQVLIDSKINYVEVPNEAAFYGPKIDVQVWSVIGRGFTLATNQVDFAVPAKFGLTYRDKDNSNKTPLCIHRAPLGTHERFIGFLIEHYAGNFPLWLAPEQVRVLTLGEEEPLLNYAKAIVSELRANFVRCEADFSSDPIKAKIAEAEKAKVHTMLVIGGRDMDAGNVSVRLHGKGNVGAKPKGEVVADILQSIKERRP